MRVLQLGKYYYPYMGGIENHLYLLCNQLKTQTELEVVVCNTSRRTGIPNRSNSCGAFITILP